MVGRESGCTPNQRHGGSLVGKARSKAGDSAGPESWVQTPPTPLGAIMSRNLIVASDYGALWFWLDCWIPQCAYLGHGACCKAIENK